MKYRYLALISLIMVFSSDAYPLKNSSVNILIDASQLKKSGFIDGQSSSVDIDLTGSGTKDSIVYTFSGSTPPGTCEQQDCISGLDNSPMITIQVKQSNGKNLDAPYMCTSLGIKSSQHNGLKDIFCGPKYTLKWNGKEYDAE